MCSKISLNKITYCEQQHSGAIRGTIALIQGIAVRLNSHIAISVVGTVGEKNGNEQFENLQFFAHEVMELKDKHSSLTLKGWKRGTNSSNQLCGSLVTLLSF